MLDAHAPRAEGETEAESIGLAEANAARGSDKFDSAPPDPRAVFVTDATILFQHERGDVDEVLRYAPDAEVVVVNALDSEELGVDDPISRRERAVPAAFEEWADPVVRFDPGS